MQKYDIILSNGRHFIIKADEYKFGTWNQNSLNSDEIPYIVFFRNKQEVCQIKLSELASFRNLKGLKPDEAEIG